MPPVRPLPPARLPASLRVAPAALRLGALRATATPRRGPDQEVNVKENRLVWR